ncbi:MAG: aromatic amino acid lyase [Buchananella hordeovulneris]|nr:aromatic amino acid lyase [Buchananella hordeovulneris]
MTSHKVTELRNYVRQSSVPSRWHAATEQIQSERTRIFAAMEQDSSLRTYGFNTMLGPNDNKALTASEQESLLAGHLIGSPQEVSQLEARAILGSKIIQLANGGTGVSPAAFSHILQQAEGCELPLEIDLLASYGSGDVVPGAWWVRATFGTGYSWQPGDVISLINGSFVSCAYSFLLLESYLHALTRFLNLTRHVFRRPTELAPMNGIDHALSSLYLERPAWDNPPQLPVSARDVFPVLHSATSALRDLFSVLEVSYSRPSGNPLFELHDGSVHARSQSSFLNLRLASTLAQINSAVSQLAGATQRAVEIVSGTLRADSESPVSAHVSLCAVQWPKVAEAYRLHLTGGTPLDFTGSMSGGVEDMWDLTLSTSLICRDRVAVFQRQLNVLEACVTAAVPEYTPALSANHLWSLVESDALAPVQ